VAVADNLKKLSDAAKGKQNLMPFILNAVESYTTLGEIADALRHVFGEY
jgi:methylmalonyl-CoA mutase N-terminal domain/subunit